jgi:hypothetical protein
LHDERRAIGILRVTDVVAERELVNVVPEMILANVMEHTRQPTSG